jgi:hypothetical protein
MSKARARRELGFCPDEDRSNSRPRDSPAALRVTSVCPFISRTTEVKKHASISCARLFAPQRLPSLLNESLSG